MDKEPPRGDGIFTCKADPDAWKSLDKKQLDNLWKKERKEDKRNFDNMMSRKEQTVAHGVTELKWMFVKSADEITRATNKHAREEYVRENEDKSKRVEQIDWSTENNESAFTFNINKWALCTRLYKTSLKMEEEKIERELEEPDDFASLNIYN